MKQWIKLNCSGLTLKSFLKDSLLFNHTLKLITKEQNENNLEIYLIFNVCYISYSFLFVDKKVNLAFRESKKVSFHQTYYLCAYIY